MSEPAEDNGFAIQCDPQGGIESILRDNWQIFSGPGKSTHFPQCVIPRSQDAARHFFSELTSEGSAISGQIRFASDFQEISLYCMGFRYKNGYLIIGAPARNLLGTVLFGTLRTGDMSDPHPPGNGEPACPASGAHDYREYEDLSRVNNELVNMQRQLVDAQIEIEMQKDELDRQIAERKKSDDAYRVANKKLNMLSSITRHDILNQVMGLRTFLELSREDLQGTPYAEFVEKEDQVAAAIQRQIEFTKFYQDIGVNAPKWQDVSEIVHDAEKQFDVLAIAVKVSISGFEIFADPLIEKVFFNLVENSLRHGERVTQVEFSVRISGDTGVILYRDNGVGIPAEDKQKLFQKGFGKHTGLGLFLSREILAITGITITENGEPGAGVQFEIVVPKDGYRFTNPAAGS